MGLPCLSVRPVRRVRPVRPVPLPRRPGRGLKGQQPDCRGKRVSGRLEVGCPRAGDGAAHIGADPGDIEYRGSRPLKGAAAPSATPHAYMLQYITRLMHVKNFFSGLRHFLHILLAHNAMRNAYFFQIVWHTAMQNAKWSSRISREVRGSLPKVSHLREGMPGVLGPEDSAEYPPEGVKPSGGKRRLHFAPLIPGERTMARAAGRFPGSGGARRAGRRRLP